MSTPISTNSKKRKANELDLANKKKVLTDIQNGMTYRLISTKYQISVGQVAAINKLKDLII